MRVKTDMIMVFATPRPPSNKAASTDGPGSSFEDSELRIGAGELGILKSDQVGKLCLDHRFERSCIVFVAKLDGDHRRCAVFVKEICAEASGMKTPPSSKPLAVLRIPITWKVP